ncbi:uncharacterized protein BDV14DRAFT_73838 [Aspergillus stella-maris]|uniref:uncharacterized protein n=1 Tax=Aspergillus stella-maris TaxID=1810926 RepID=UPI003CCDD59A
MPGPIITTEHVLPVRELEDDELFVTDSFEQHVDRCGHCFKFLHGKNSSQPSLCDRGIQYARDVDQYIYSKRGRPYSAVARDHSQPTLLKVPRAFESTRALLLDIEDGLSLKRTEKEHTAVQPVKRSTSPVISYDRTYHIPPRRTQTQEVTEIIERQPRNIKTRRYIVYHSPSRSSPARGSPSRGSLYDSDAADRHERARSSRIYRPAEYYR